MARPAGRYSDRRLLHRRPFVARLADNSDRVRGQSFVTGAPISSVALFTNDIKDGRPTYNDKGYKHRLYLSNTLKVIKVTGADIKAASKRAPNSPMKTAR